MDTLFCHRENEECAAREFTPDQRIHLRAPRHWRTTGAAISGSSIGPAIRRELDLTPLLELDPETQPLWDAHEERWVLTKSPPGDRTQQARAAELYSAALRLDPDTLAALYAEVVRRQDP